MFDDSNSLSEPVLRGLHLTRGFGEGNTRTLAVNDVSIEVGAGQFVLLMGPSGSGKSTLLALLSGLLHPDAGKVIALDHDLWSLSDSAREKFRLRYCGFIFQGYNLFGSLTARQQLEMVVRWGEGASAREARRRADEILALLGLAERAHLRPIELSGGEKQRVAIGRALIKEPMLCFADEPTSALDWTNGQQVVELLRSASHDRNAAVIVVSHDPRIIPYADAVFHLEDGRMTDTDELEAHLLHGHANGHGAHNGPGTAKSLSRPSVSGSAGGCVQRQ
jgi:putative ABC transport system ATP-binding protein